METRTAAMAIVIAIAIRLEYYVECSKRCVKSYFRQYSLARVTCKQTDEVDITIWFGRHAS